MNRKRLAAVLACVLVVIGALDLAFGISRHSLLQTADGAWVLGIGLGLSGLAVRWRRR